jgi:hypothetical protein
LKLQFFSSGRHTSALTESQNTRLKLERELFREQLRGTENEKFTFAKAALHHAKESNLWRMRFEELAKETKTTKELKFMEDHKMEIGKGRGREGSL